MVRMKGAFKTPMQQGITTVRGVVMNNDSNTIVMNGRWGQRLPVRVTGDKPEMTPDFSVVSARVCMDARVRLEGMRGFSDGDKLHNLIGNTKPDCFTPSSILGELVDRLSRQFKTPVRVLVNPPDHSKSARAGDDLSYELELSPVPDGVTTNNFTAAVRQTLRRMSVERGGMQARSA